VASLIYGQSKSLITHSVILRGCGSNLLNTIKEKIMKLYGIVNKVGSLYGRNHAAQAFAKFYQQMPKFPVVALYPEELKYQLEDDDCQVVELTSAQLRRSSELVEIVKIENQGE
jgi:hypothetical protein